MALLTAAGVVPVLCVSLAVDRIVAALMAAALSAALLAIVLTSLPAVTGVVRRVWSAFGFAIAGGGFDLSYAPPSSLVQATPMDAAAGISTLVSSLLLVAWAVAIAWSWKGEANVWAGSAAVVVYAVTTFAVTAGVLVGGTGGGFFAGHMAATICWIAMAAALFVYAARLARSERSLPIGAGLALVAAAMAKLFLFDLGTLDGIFRVVVFIVVGWAWGRAMPGSWRSRTSSRISPRDPSHTMIWTHSRLSRVDLNMDTTTRRTEAEVQGFQASPELSTSLQRVLVDLIELHLQGKQAHWNVVGTNFRDLHLQLDELVDFAREASDTIAERMRALDAVPDGRSDTVAVTTSVPQFPAYEHSTTEVVDLITGRTYAAVDTMRSVHDAVDAEDPSTADILHQLIDGLEKLAWLIKSENRKV